MSAWNISGPGSASGGKLEKGEHLGHLQLAVGAELKADVQTAFGVSDTAACRYWVCVECDLVLRDFLLFGQALVPRVLEAADAGAEIVAGRLARASSSKAGQSAAWILTFPDEQDLSIAGKWLDEHAARMPSGRIEIDAVEPKVQAPTSEPF